MKAIEASLADSGGASMAASCNPLSLIKEDLSIPSGIKNQGATCYMNSFLQALFTVTNFKKTLYEWSPSTEGDDSSNSSEKIVCEKLQQLFASLEYTNKKFVDSYELVSALGIDPSVQEDPQEFWSLFLSFVERIIPSTAKLFFGEMHSIVKCLKCGKANAVPYGFNTVNLSAKSESFEKALDQYMKIEELSDENRYACKGCGFVEHAQRVTQIKNLPPFLNFSIMRYEYGPHTQSRNKIIFPFSFPLTIDFSKFVYPKDPKGKPLEYELIAVLEHKGKSANSGHYICKTIRNGKWYEFNDELVTEIDLDKILVKVKTDWGAANKLLASKPQGAEAKRKSKQTKPPESPQSTPAENKDNSNEFCANKTEETYPRITSDDVYMLLYKHKDILLETYDVSASLLSKVLDENNDLEGKVKCAKDEAVAEEERKKELSKFKQDIMKEASTQMEGDLFWMSLPWWEEFVLADHIIPIDNTGLTCPHGFINIKMKDKVKCIKKTSWEKLVAFCGLKDESVQPLRVGDYCQLCTKEYCDEISLKKEAANEFEKILFLLQNPTEEGSARYYVSKKWISDWKECHDAMEGSDIVEDIVCEHGNLTIDKKKRRCVPEDVFKYLKLNYDCSKVFIVEETEPCPLCAGEKTKANDLKKELEQKRANAKKTFSSLISSKSGPKSSGKFYALDLSWFEYWKNWLESSDLDECAPFDNKALLCEHGMFQWNPNPSPESEATDPGYVLVPESQYPELKNMFGEKGTTDVSITYNGKSDPTVSREVCWDCFLRKNEEAQTHFVDSFVTLCLLPNLEYDSIDAALAEVKASESIKRSVVSIKIVKNKDANKTKPKESPKSTKKLKVEGVSHDFLVSGLKTLIIAYYSDEFKNPNEYPLSLIVNDTEMKDDDSPISSYGVRAGSEVYLVLIKPPSPPSPPSTPQSSASKKKVSEQNGFSGSVLLSSKN